MSRLTTRLWSTFLFLLSLLMLLAAALALMLLPDQIAEYQREPEDVYLGVFWSIVPLVIGLLLAAAALRGHGTHGQHRRRNYLMRGLMTVFGLVLITMGIFSRLDVHWMVPAGLVCMVTAVIPMRLRHNGKHQKAEPHNV